MRGNLAKPGCRWVETNNNNNNNNNDTTIYKAP